MIKLQLQIKHYLISGNMESKSTGILLILPVKNLKFQNRKFKKKWGKMIYGYPGKLLHNSGD